LYYFIAISIILFLGLFIYLFFKIYKDIRNQTTTAKDAYGKLILFLVLSAWGILSLIYFDLSSKNIHFVDYYSFDVEGKKAITIGRGDENGKDTFLVNPLAVNSHLLLRLDENESDKIGKLELLTDRRKAIVNDILLENLSQTENSIRDRLALSSLHKSKEKNSSIEISDGDFIRIGYSNYRITKENNKIILDNVSLNFLSPINLFYLYTTTTYPDKFIGERQGITTTSIWWLWAITSVVFFLFSTLLFLIILKIQSYRTMGKNWAIIHPILYFTIFLEFLFLTSLINFTIMYFYQFNIYEKGSLFTELVVFGVIFIFGVVVYFIQKSHNRIKSSGVAITIYLFILSIFIFYSKTTIYSSTKIAGVIPKDMFIFFGEQMFIFTIFMLFAILISSDKAYIFRGKYISQNIYTFIALGGVILVIITAILSALHLIREGQGMVFIESAKLFAFLLLTLSFHHSFKRNRWQYTPIMLILFLALIGSIGLLKDSGSLLQVVLALGIIFIFFKDAFDIKKRWILLGIGALIGLGYLFYQIELKENVRYAMWINPFGQENEPSTQFFMYRYEQVARGLFLIKSSGWLPSNFIDNSFLPLPAIHTDFIFAFFSNTFGHFGVIALIFSLIILSLSFKRAMKLYSKESELYKFMYGINSVFIAYMLSYFLINISSVLQIIPLTDVPLPFLTYAKGILILFIMLYLFIVTFNIKYLEHLKEKNL